MASLLSLSHDVLTRSRKDFLDMCLYPPLTHSTPSSAPATIPITYYRYHDIIKEVEERGQIGSFFHRDKIIHTPARIEINPVEFHTAICYTLFDFNSALQKMKCVLFRSTSTAIAHNFSSILADGCCIMAYLKLKIVSAVDLQYQIKYAPAFPDQGHDFGLPPGCRWSSGVYCDAVTYARSLGMQFSTVDLKKEGRLCMVASVALLFRRKIRIIVHAS